MKVLVTGANGFVGRNVANYLSRSGLTVTKTDVSDADIDGDITNEQFVLGTLAEADFDTVAHFAAYVNVPGSMENPYQCYRTNCFGTLNLLELAKRKNVSRFLYASSNNVYGPNAKLPVKETAPVNPRTPYDHSKRIAELMVQSYGTHKKLPTVILRSWKLFGEHDVPNTAVSRFIGACLKNEPLPLYNRGRETNDFYHVENYCRAVDMALKDDRVVGEVFNVGTGKEISARKLAEKIRELTGSKSQLTLLPPRSPLEKVPMRTRPSILKIRRVLGYNPTVNLEEGLKRTIKWFRS